MDKIVVTFDFDKTLSKKHVQEYVKELLQMDIDVWIVTSRYDDLHTHNYDNSDYNNSDIFAVADELNIPRWKIRFTCMEWKFEYLLGTNAIWHLDDNQTELYKLNTSGAKTIGIQVNSGSWKNKCNRLIMNIINKKNNI